MGKIWTPLFYAFNASRKMAGISSSALAILGKGQSVAIAIRLRICKILNCGLYDIDDAVLAENASNEYRKGDIYG